MLLGQEDPLEEEWQPSPVFLPGESHGQKSLAGYSPWGRKEQKQLKQLSSSSSNSSRLYPTRLRYPWDFSRKEYWSVLPFLLQGIFLTQGLIWQRKTHILDLAAG